jgi:CxxC-x17-CxxC domain-containing protein
MPEYSIGSVVFTLKAVDEATAAVRNSIAAMDSLHSITEKLGGGFAAAGDMASAAFKGFAAGGPVGAAIAGGTELINQTIGALQTCVKAASESEQAFTNLKGAVERSGTAWDMVSKATEGTFLAMQKVTVYSDEQLASTLERLLSFGLSYDDAMKALSTTVDFAAAKHMDLESAATIVGKALDGNTALLKRYGIEVTTSRDAAAALKDAQDGLSAAFEAMGGDLADYAAGLMDSVGVTGEFAQALSNAKDPAKFLIEQFQQGNIDLPQFMSILKELGVTFDDAKLKAGGTEEVLKALNEQFGGAAQQQAQTYVGIQERLKNATDELNERIGRALLPTLSSLTEGMIGVVDGISGGIDALGQWFAEIGKSETMKPIMDALSESWSGLMKWFEDAGKIINELLGPALQELNAKCKFSMTHCTCNMSVASCSKSRHCRQSGNGMLTRTSVEMSLEMSNQMTKIKCSQCGADAEVPFVPDGRRAVYCQTCWRAKRDAQRAQAAERIKRLTSNNAWSFRREAAGNE